MNTDHRAILTLIAMGRITPREAERLLAVWPDRSDALWAGAACVAAALMALPEAHGLLPEAFGAAQHALTVLAHWMGGVL